MVVSLVEQDSIFNIDFRRFHLSEQQTMTNFPHYACRYRPSVHSSLLKKNSFLRQVALNLSTSHGRTGSENSSKNEFSRIRCDNPFEILGVSKTATYTEVKQRFLELALKHHPDHATNKKGGDAISNCRSDDFIRFRQAFESLKEVMDGTATQVEGVPAWSDEEFNAWYYEETGHADLMFRMDMKTRKEVIDVANQQAQGGLDRGGMWEMARRMAEEELILKDSKNRFKRTVGLRQSSVSAKADANSNVHRRRRKRK